MQHSVVNNAVPFKQTRSKKVKTGNVLEKKLDMLFASQNLGVLATQQNEHPYTSLVAFACSDDLHHIVFATPTATRKFANITHNEKVSFFVDNRTNKAADFRQAVGVTCSGTVRKLEKTKESKLLKRYLAKHPHLASFLWSPSCAFLCIDVTSFTIVERFQHVTELTIAP